MPRAESRIRFVQAPARQPPTATDAVREALAWLGDCNRDRAGHSTHLTYRFAPEVAPDTTLNVKIEVNTREHKSLLGVKTYPFELLSGWHQAKTEIASFEPEELFGTKLRALLQRRQGRDLFDLNEGLKQLGLDTGKVIACFEHYLELEGHPITRAEAEQRMLGKLARSLTEESRGSVHGAAVDRTAWSAWKPEGLDVVPASVARTDAPNPDRIPTVR